jgi:DNA helicase HerA-like ATPase
MPAHDLERLGAFYLGRLHDLEARRTLDEPYLYDAKDLTTHAVCVGMTGSGKTGLCVTLLEEAALDGIPAIAIDPKGDLGNLLLTFPELRPSDFQPWIDPAEAARKGVSVEALAEDVARTWRDGLAAWGQDGARIRRFRDAVDLALYTPGSSAGLPLSVLRSLDAPPAAAAGDAELLRERVTATVSGLLTLLGLDADPVKSREHVLLSTLVHRAWAQGRALDLPALIREVPSPSVDRVGVLDLESFFPARDRFGLAMALNNLLAAPAFAAWTTGEPLDVGRLLYRPDGRPRLSIVSIAHLPEAERMFLVTLLLSEVVTWMRAQPGTGSLRAILYMDEVFGYLPPTANPPSKTPLLTLLKQARAYGLGVVLATQNPVDLDYKALSNAGTWFLGRLQTERDKLRVLDGLEGASAQAGRAFDRARAEATLGALAGRVFLASNAHEDEPVVIQSRWALSYLRGPLTREQVRTLVATRPPPPAPVPVTATPAGAAGARPVLPPGVDEVLLAPKAPRVPGERWLWRPRLLGVAKVHHVHAEAGLDAWSTLAYLTDVPEGEVPASPWAGATTSPLDAIRQDGVAADDDAFEALPGVAARPASHAAWRKALASHVLETAGIRLWRCRSPKLLSRPGEAEGDFRARCVEAQREARDAAVEKLRRKLAPALERLRTRRAAAEARVAREQAEYGQAKVQAGISFGATLIGALLGRKVVSSGSVGRATTAMRGATRAMQQRDDVGRAAESVESLQADAAQLEEECARELDALRASFDPAALGLEELRVPPRKADIEVGTIALAWQPWRPAAGGLHEPA